MHALAGIGFCVINPEWQARNLDGFFLEYAYHTAPDIRDF